MSFLMRNRGNSGKARFPPRASSSSQGNVTGRASAHGTNQVHRESTASIASGNQIQIQRPAEECQRLQTSRLGAQVSQMAPQQQDLDAQGVISMTEVLADLRVLEQQQKDAERKLKNARVVRSQRLEQQHALQCKLERLKYTNGELRAQLRQSRDHLSTGTRSLGARRLVTDKIGGDIREFEKVLKRGLQSARVNAACQRKIDSVFILLENKLSTLARLKAEAQRKLNELVLTMKAELRKEENLRSSIQKEAARILQYSSEITNVRAQNIEAEKDLLAAQNAEESTRTRARALAQQIESEKKQVEEKQAQLSSQIVTNAKKAEELAAQNELATNDLKGKVKELSEAKANQDTSFAHKDADGIFLRGEVEASIASSQSRANQLAIDNDALKAQIEAMQLAIRTNCEDSAMCQKASEALTDSSEEMLAVEKTRSEELCAFSSELDLERKAVEKLKVSAQELQESRTRISSSHSKAVLECETVLEEARQEIDLTKSAIENENREIEIDKSIWTTENADILRRLEEARENFKVAEASLNGLDLMSKHLEDDSESRLRIELLSIEERQAAERRAIDAHVSSVLIKFPKLQSVVANFVYDSKVDVKTHMHEALGTIKSELRSKIQDAKADYQRRNEAQKDSMHKANEASKELKRKDEERRKSRERLQANLKRVEAKDQFENHAYDDGKGGSKRPTMPLAAQSQPPQSRKSSKERKGAEFFVPQSQDHISEEDTPAQPKSLLSSFSNARNTSHAAPPLDLTPNSDKRVHWKENTRGDYMKDEFVDHNAATKPARVSKQYGTAKRGLAAISLAKKDGKKAPNLEPTKEPKMHLNESLDAGSDDSSVDELVELVKAQKKINAPFDHGTKLQYGTAKRGLAAISLAKKDGKKAPNVEPTKEPKMHLNESLDAGSDDSSVDELVELVKAQKKINAPFDHGTNRHSYAASEVVLDSKAPPKKGQRSYGMTTKPSTSGQMQGLSKAQVLDATIARKMARSLAQECSSKPHSGGSHTPEARHDRGTGALRVQKTQKENRPDKSYARNASLGDGLAKVKGYDNAHQKQRPSLESRESVEKHTSRACGSSKSIARDSSNKRNSRLVPWGSTHFSNRSESANGTRPVSSGKSTSKAVGSAPVRGPGRTDRSTGSTASQKRKANEQNDAATQASGLSSYEGGNKPRRRKKTGTSLNSSMNLANDAYSFAF